MWVVDIGHVPKLGNAVDEYEDAYAWCPGRFAIADGAAESSFADRWAKLLVQSFVEQPLTTLDSSKIRQWLEPLRLQWANQIDWASLSWFAVRKAQCGAFSSLLGLEFLGDDFQEPHTTDIARDELYWRSVAVGDSCLFQLRDRMLVKTFPIAASTDFGNRPVLISTNPASDGTVEDASSITCGTAQWNDAFLLATDALAQWFLREHEKSADPWSRAIQALTAGEFEEFISELRAAQAIRNDDTTLVVVALRQRCECSLQNHLETVTT